MTEEEPQDDKLDMIRQEAERLFGKKDKYTSEEYGKAVSGLLKQSKKRKPRTKKAEAKPDEPSKTSIEYNEQAKMMVDNFTENGWSIPKGNIVLVPKKKKMDDKEVKDDGHTGVLEKPKDA